MTRHLHTRLAYRDPIAVPWIPSSRDLVELIALAPSAAAISALVHGDELPVDAENPDLGTLHETGPAPPKAHPDHVTTDVEGMDLTIGSHPLQLAKASARLKESISKIAMLAKRNRDAKPEGRVYSDCGVELELLPGQIPWPYPPRAKLLAPDQKDAIMTGMDKLVKAGAVSVLHPPPDAPPGWYPKAEDEGRPVCFVPIFAVSQKNKIRIVADCRALNKQLAPSVPAPAVPTHSYLDKLNGPNVVRSQCDLAKAFWQLGLKKSPGCVRVLYPSPDGSFWWEAEATPTGAKTSPGALHAWISKKLAHLPQHVLEATMVYADNIYFATLRTGNDAEDYAAHLDIVAAVIEALTVGPQPATINFGHDGSQFCVRSMDVLGNRVGDDGIKITRDRLVQFEDYEADFPTTCGGLASLVGKLHFVLSMVPGLAGLAEPLRPPPGLKGPIAALARRPEHAAWAAALRPAFDKVMQAVRDAPPLAQRDYSLRPIIFSDGSRFGRAAILCNLLHLGPVGDGKYEVLNDRPGTFRIGESTFELVLCASALTPPEHAHRTAPLLELLAVGWALEKFRPYFGAHVPLVATDSQALAMGVEGASNSEGLMAKRALDLIDAHGAIDVTYIRGKVHPADGLSRLPLHAAGVTHLDGQEIIRTHVKQRKQRVASPEDVSLSQHINARAAVVTAITRATAIANARPKAGGTPPSPPAAPAPPQTAADAGPATAPAAPVYVPWRELVVEGKRIPPIADPADPWHPGLPFRDPGSRRLREEIMKAEHDDASHPGRDATLDSIRALGFGWAGMLDDIARHVHNCRVCLTSKHSKKPLTAPRTYTNGKAAPWVSIHCDVMQIPGASPDQPRYVYVIADRFSTFLIAVPLERNTAAETARVFKSVTAILGNPSVVVTDNGPETEADFAALLQARGIRHDRSTALFKQGNGLCERAVRSIRNIMRVGIGENDVFGDDWLDHVQRATYCYNIRLNKRIGMAPATAFLGRDINLAPPIIPASLNAPKHVPGTLEDMESVAEAIERIKAKMEDDRLRHERIVLDDIERRNKKVAKFHKDHAKPVIFKEGDFVSILATNRHKTQHPATYPPRRVAVANDGTYTLYKMDQEHIDKSRKYKAEQLKAWKGDPPPPLFNVRDVVAAKVTEEGGKRVVRVLIAWKDYHRISDRSWERSEEIRPSIPQGLMRKFERLTAAKLAKIQG
jgi:hypothetical protein